MAEQRPWHQYFGLSWMDFFRGTSFVVEPERDLSYKQQLLDLLVIRTEAEARPPRRLPDGFEDLGRYNLISFKSYQEALDGWTLNELVGHYVNLRKQVSPSMQSLLPETDFRVFAVCARYPQNLSPPEVTLEQVQQGVYRVRHFSGYIRIVVIHRLPPQPHNAMLHLFSAEQALVEYGAQNYKPYSDETSTLLQFLIARYRMEGLPMHETIEQFEKRARRELVQQLTPEERLEGMPVEKRLEGISVKQLLASLTPEQRAELNRRLDEDDASRPQ